MQILEVEFLYSEQPSFTDNELFKIIYINIYRLIQQSEVEKSSEITVTV